MSTFEKGKIIKKIHVSTLKNRKLESIEKVV